MANQYYPSGAAPSYTNGAPNLQFYQSTYPAGGAPAAGAAPYGYSATPMQNTFGGDAGFGGVSGRMGEQGGLRTGWLAAFGTEGYEGEPPLLEELGVNFGHIKTKTFTVLSPLSPTPIHLMDDADLAGPILFFLLFGTFLLFSGKVHFGYIYGLALIGSLSLHTIFSLMSPPLDATSPTSAAFPGAAGPSYGAGGGASGGAAASNEGRLSATLTFPRSASVLGYCLLPLVLISCIGIVMPMDTMTGYLLNCLAISWCTYSSSKIFCAVGRMHSMRALVAYPLALFYVGFGLMGIFSSKGSTLGSKVTA